MDAWLTKRYRRDRVRYLRFSLEVMVAIVLFMVAPIGLFFPARYEGLPFGWYLLLLGIGDVVIVTLLGIACVLLRRQIHDLLAWARRPSAELAPAARVVAFEGPRRLAGHALGLGPLALPLIALLAFPTHHTQPLDWVELTFGASTGVLVAALNAWFSLDILLRPVRAELGLEAAQRRPASLLARVSLLVPVMAWVAASAGGYVVTSRARAGAGHLLVVYAIGLAATTVFALALAPLLVGGIIAPIRDLIRAARAVAAGRTGTRVPVTSTDELGELAIAFNRMLDELLGARRRIVAASDEARHAVERDLHDGAQQHLVLLGLKLGLLKRLIETDSSRAAELLEEMGADLARAQAELRDLAHGIYPVALVSEGLAAALAQIVQRPPLPATLDCDGAGRYPSEVETSVYFCCLEALQNAAKHAGADARAWIRLQEQGGTLTFVVADDGLGFDSAGPSRSAGLQNMADRLAVLGGTLDVRSAPGAGTTVRGTVPVSPAATEAPPATPALVPGRERPID